MKNRKILAMLLSIVMVCSSFPAYAAVDDVSSEPSLNPPSHSSSSGEVLEAAQNDESSSQPESDASSEEAVDNENNSQAESNASSEKAIENEDNSQVESNASSEQAVESENNSLTGDTNTNAQIAEDSQPQDTFPELSVYYLNNGDIDIYYANGAYHITQNSVECTHVHTPIILASHKTSNKMHLHDFVPDENNSAPHVIICHLTISNNSTAIEIDGTVNLQVEGDCSLKTTSRTSAAMDVDENADLTISGSGSLNVSSSGNGAAIGGAGVINASTKEYGAPTCGNIEITGDVKVTAKNTGSGAGIGGGYSCGTASPQYGGDVKNITIGGNADVTATSNGGSAAIGGGGVKAGPYVGVGGDCSSVTIKDNAKVNATANGKGTAAIGSGANDNAYIADSSAGTIGTISILDYATVYAVGGFVAIGTAADVVCKSEISTFKHTDLGELCIASTTSLDSYSKAEVPINSKCKSIDDVQNSNMIIGSFKDNPAMNSQKVLQMVDTDSKKHTKDINMPAGTESFAFNIPSAGNYAMLSEKAASDTSNPYKVDQVIKNMDNDNFLFAANPVENGKSFSDYTVSVKLIEKTVNMDLSNGSITISKIDDVIYIEQNGQTETMPLQNEDITITQSSPEATENNITIKGSIDGAQPIIVENLNISCEHPIILEEGADVHFIFHNNNSLTATNCKKSTDYPAIEVPSGTKVTLSGDGSLEATADGYAAAIGTKGYYRDGKLHGMGKSSGSVQIGGDLKLTAHSAYGAGIGGGAISGSCCVQIAFSASKVTIKDNAVVEALGSIKGSYSAGIGGGGCYTSSCKAFAGSGAQVQILDNAQVTAASLGSLGAGIGGGGAYGKTKEAYGGDGRSFKADNNTVVIAGGSEYAPGIGGGSAHSCATYTGASGSCSVLGHSNITVQGGEHAENFGTGKHIGGSLGNCDGDYTKPIVDPTTTVYTDLAQPSINIDLCQGSVALSKTDDKIAVKQKSIQVLVPSGSENITITQSSPEATENNITIKGSIDGAQPIIVENLNISCEQPIIVEDGADANLIVHNNNSLTATNCQQSIDYPAMEVPDGATVTLSGDGSLEATADGYAAAIGTRGYYRDEEDHSDSDKSSGTLQIEDSLNVKAHSAYGAGIGGGAISGSSCEQHAFDNGTVIIKDDAVVEAFGSTEGSYSAGIGGGGCYTSTCAAVGGNGGDVQILDNAQVTAACKGSLGAGIGGGGGCGKTSDGFGGDGESFKADNNAVVVATGGKYGPGIGGGGAQQKTCCATHPGNSGSCSVLAHTNVTLQGGEHAENFGTGGHTGGWVNYKGERTTPLVDRTATFNV